MRSRGFHIDIEVQGHYFDFERMITKYGISGYIAVFTILNDYVYEISYDDKLDAIFWKCSVEANAIPNRKVIDAYNTWVAENILLE